MKPEKSRTPKGMRRYIKILNYIQNSILSKKIEYSQVKSLMNTQYGRDDGIWTHNLYVPNVALYQIEPHLVIKFLFSVCGMLCGHFVFLKYFPIFLKWLNPKCIKACSDFWVLVEPWELRFPERSALPNWATPRCVILLNFLFFCLWDVMWSFRFFEVFFKISEMM